MLYLIGGAPRSGKTTTAKKLSETLSVPWISTDTLESIVTDYVLPSEADKLFPKNVLRRTTNQSNDEMYTRYSTEEIVDAYIQNGKSLAQAITTFIDCEFSYGHDYILEGHHIHPALIIELQKKYPVTSVFLGRRDVETTLKAITENTLPTDWVVRKTKHETTYPLIAKMLCAFSAYIESESTQHATSYVVVDSSFEATIQTTVEKLSRASV